MYSPFCFHRCWTTLAAPQTGGWRLLPIWRLHLWPTPTGSPRQPPPASARQALHLELMLKWKVRHRPFSTASSAFEVILTCKMGGLLLQAASCAPELILKWKVRDQHLRAASSALQLTLIDRSGAGPSLRVASRWGTHLKGPHVSGKISGSATMVSSPFLCNTA